MATEVGDLIGTWTLVCWDYSVDGEHKGFPMGEDAKGQIIYAADGGMSAILKQAERPRFEEPGFHYGTQEQREMAAMTYVSYGGTFDLEDDRVLHHVAYSLFPDWVGTDLIRTVSWEGDQLLLTGLPDISKSGKSVVNRLLWRRGGSR